MKQKLKLLLVIIVTGIVMAVTTGNTNKITPKYSRAATMVSSPIQNNGTNAGIGIFPVYQLDVGKSAGITYKTYKTFCIGSDHTKTEKNNTFIEHRSTVRTKLKRKLNVRA